MVTPTSDRDARDRFTALAGRVAEPVRRYLLRRTDPATAEELLNETLTVCWRRLAAVPPEAEVAWAIGVARQCLANARRAERRRRLLVHRIAVLDPEVWRPQERAPTSESTSTQDEVSAALVTLPAKDAEVLRLWAWEDLGPTEIGQVLGITPNAATVRLHRAKGRLKAALTRTELTHPGGDPR